MPTENFLSMEKLFTEGTCDFKIRMLLYVLRRFRAMTIPKAQYISMENFFIEGSFDFGLQTLLSLLCLFSALTIPRACAI